MISVHYGNFNRFQSSQYYSGARPISQNSRQRTIDFINSARDIDYTVDHTIFTNDDDYILGLRLAVAEGYIYPEVIRIYYWYDNPLLAPIWLSIHRDGSMSYWPQGFCDATTDCLMRILDSRMAK